jgi:hypothetical protein
VKKTNLDLAVARVMSLNADIRNVALHLTALENLFSVLETSVNGRLAALEARSRRSA